MRRRFRPARVVGGPVLALAAAGVWVWSEIRGGAIVAYTGGRVWEARSSAGCVVLGWGSAPVTWRHVNYAGDGYFEEAWLPGPQGFFHVERVAGVTRLWVPLWVPVVVGVLMVGWGVPWGREPMAGHCAGCGYDLLGNVSGVCPECGRAIPGRSGCDFGGGGNDGGVRS